MSTKRTGGFSVAHRLIGSDPNLFFRRELGKTLWHAQRKALDLLATHDRVAIASANACGKSFLAAGTVPWYLCSRPSGYVVTTGASWRGLKKILWPEIHRVLSGAANHELRRLGTLNEMEWNIAPQYGAFSVSTNDVENFGGYRTPHGVYVIVDEASSLSDEMMEAIEGVCSAAGSKVLLIGNPLRSEGPFYRAFKSPAWATMHISALDSPNVKSGRNLIPGLATREWVEERRRDWGQDSPSYKARVLGQFPEGTGHSLISLAEAEAAAARYDSMQATEPHGTIQIGCDVARYGEDATVLAVRCGHCIVHLERHYKLSLMEVSGVVANAIRDYRPVRVCIDDIGIGGGVTDRLRELGHDCVVGVNVAESALDAEHFLNKRAEGWWALKEWIKDGGTFPDDRAIIASVTSTGYKFSSGGKIQMESKDDVKKRLGKSPDEADAIILSIVNPYPEVQLW